MIDDDPDSKLAKKLESDVLKNAEKALDELVDVPPDRDKAIKKIEETGKKLDKIIDDGLLGITKGNELHDQLGAVTEAIRQDGGYEKCRGSKYTKHIKKNQGGVIYHCGHSIEVGKDALKHDSELSIHVLDTEDVIVDFGPDGWFNKMVEITLNTEDMDLSGIDDDNIVLVWYDETTETWYEVDAKFDRKKNQLKAKVWHFTQYTLSLR
ncbi:MAG: hypothetical protein DWQ10_13325 [Calditrichaeota bacterium]|nr:MAG: hypothetical protein DWQ10_13325 [Calditrichota bacterium]